MVRVSAGGSILTWCNLTLMFRKSEELNHDSRGADGTQKLDHVACSESMMLIKHYSAQTIYGEPPLDPRERGCSIFHGLRVYIDYLCVM